jgi:DNA-binding NarL/FixJ family response regulator
MEVALVDAHDALRGGLEILLQRRGIKTVGATGTVGGAVELFREQQPDVAVVDIQLRDGSGLDLVRELRVEQPEIAILIYTGIEEVGTLVQALESGARGFVLKLGDIDQLPLLLTKREREVFDLLAQGLTGEEIATHLTIAPETVRTHIRNAMEKLQARTRTGAVVQALRTNEIRR